MRDMDTSTHLTTAPPSPRKEQIPVTDFQSKGVSATSSGVSPYNLESAFSPWALKEDEKQQLKPRFQLPNMRAPTPPLAVAPFR